MPSHGEKEIAAERRNQALQLRKTGASYRAIGRQLHISEAQAHRDVAAALKVLAKIQDDLATDLRTLELARLDDMQMALSQQVKAGNLGAADRWLRIMERRAKLTGIDAPEKQDRTGDMTIRIIYASDD